MTARSTNGTREEADDAELAAVQAEVEAAEAQAAATAARARAKAAQLRRRAKDEEARQAELRAASDKDAAEAAAIAPEAAPKIESASAVVEGDKAVIEDEANYPDDAYADDAYPEDEDDLDETSDGRRFKLVWWWPAIAISAALLLLCALLFASGYMIKQHHDAAMKRELQSQFEAGARQDVVNLMSLNFNSAKSDLQRVLDTTTGQFRDDFQKSTQDFLSVMQESKVVTTASVSAVAVESMTDDSAVVLVAAVSQVANSASQQPTPRNWRLSVTVNKVNDQIKMSRVEFVP
jgi:Mce-associated membrane protein